MKQACVLVAILLALGAVSGAAMPAADEQWMAKQVKEYAQARPGLEERLSLRRYLQKPLEKEDDVPVNMHMLKQALKQKEHKIEMMMGDKAVDVEAILFKEASD